MECAVQMGHVSLTLSHSIVSSAKQKIPDENATILLCSPKHVEALKKHEDVSEEVLAIDVR